MLTGSVDYAYVQGRLRSPNEIIYDPTGKALNFVLSDDMHEGEDVLANLAEQEEASVRGVGAALAAKYSLDTEVALNAARMLGDWNRVSATRARTEAELAEFASRTYGVSLQSFKSTADRFKKGDKAVAMEQADKLVGQAATYWKTTPENMKKILKDFYAPYFNGSN